MFGPFRGPLPEGAYYIQNPQYESLYSLSIANDTAVTGIKVNTDNRDESRTWILEYGRFGYRIKNKTNGNILSYTPWAVPSRLIGQDNHIMSSADSPVEWELIRTSGVGQSRAFQLRIVAGDHFKSTDDIALGCNSGKCQLLAGASGTSFTFQSITATGTIPSSLTIAHGTTCHIRSVFSPRLALEYLPSAGNIIVARAVSEEDSQLWTFEQVANGFKIKNVQSNKYLDAAVVPNTPRTDRVSMVCQDNISDDWGHWNIVKSLQGFELRAIANLNYLVALWDSDAGNNAWAYRSFNRNMGTAETGEQWVFTKPGQNQ
ncbi:hypothetical protein FRB94_006750 [Tulasnella sp. JGI-2019a]|nr:hypothetical protein FRB94_006750 [Tulasnella sp. JGI-2019a]